MVRNIEFIEKNQPYAALLLDACRQLPDTFISFEHLRDRFNWSVVTTLTAVGDAQQHLTNDALYTISLEGVVYESARVPVGEKIYPSKFRPEPIWLSDSPKYQDLRDLLQRLRFAKVESETSAAPPLTPDEHLLLMRLVANYPEQCVSMMRELRLVFDVTENRIYSLVSETKRKLIAETRGEWIIDKERRGGLCYVVKHNGV